MPHYAILRNKNAEFLYTIIGTAPSYETTRQVAHFVAYLQGGDDDVSILFNPEFTTPEACRKILTENIDDLHSINPEFENHWFSPSPEGRMIVSMCGGCIEDVFVDANCPPIKVVFTEDERECELEEDEVFVERGSLQGKIIYSCCESETVDNDLIDPVFVANEKRINQE